VGDTKDVVQVQGAKVYGFLTVILKDSVSVISSPRRRRFVDTEAIKERKTERIIRMSESVKQVLSAAGRHIDSASIRLVSCTSVFCKK
jgi:hypothetical protein